MNGNNIVFYVVYIDNSSRTNIGLGALNVDTIVDTDPIYITTTNSIYITGEIPAGQFGSSGYFNAQFDASSVVKVTFIGFTIYENIPIFFEVPLD